MNNWVSMFRERNEWGNRIFKAERKTERNYQK